jgi:predicted Zn-dependent protease with MMP-like domain
VYEVSRDEFEALVLRSIEGLPPEFRSRIANVELVVELRPTAEDLARTGVAPGSTLLGVYRGIPLPKRHSGYNMALPDRIVIFQEPIQLRSADVDDLQRQVRRVVRHEIAHYFGISDERLREIDAY